MLTDTMRIGSRVAENISHDDKRFFTTTLINICVNHMKNDKIKPRVNSKISES